MRARVVIVLLLAAGLPAVLLACRRETATVGPTLPTGAPVLRRAAGPALPYGAHATLALASPARLRVLYRRDGVEERTVTEATFPGGHLVELYFEGLPHARPTRVDPLPPAQAREEGRDEVHGCQFRASLGSALGVHTLDPTVWTRAGLAQTRARALVPSSLGDVVPFGTEVELAAIAVADTDGGTLAAETVDGRTAARIEGGGGGEDRLHVMRLILRVDEAGDGRSERP